MVGKTRAVVHYRTELVLQANQHAIVVREGFVRTLGLAVWLRAQEARHSPVGYREVIEVVAAPFLERCAVVLLLGVREKDGISSLPPLRI
jgi:hypothetical protein